MCITSEKEAIILIIKITKDYCFLPSKYMLCVGTLSYGGKLLKFNFDNLILHTCRVPLTLTWKNISKKIDIHWFQYESDPSRNSNVYEVAQKVVNDNFPGEFGSERLVQQVVDSILASTELRENLQQVKGQHPTEAPPLQGMEGMASSGGGGGGSSGSSPNKAQESEGTIILFMYKLCIHICSLQQVHNYI